MAPSKRTPSAGELDRISEGINSVIKEHVDPTAVST
eukprot:CAMPEP_0185787364 /NCGR_PEP_ID=MMETSP1174-20130828/140182_1 /TAXON_ID=35687 /ORGANISM="Dictyocha speculum, Strain CCMP1381" /LENGTH=35 /DNA_ID= /DNA_START= /DNA_END= /DNA_ORIENTATION=